MNKIPDKNKCCIREKNDCCIQVFDMCVEFENNLALDNVSFSISQGVLTGVVGPNGGGKSTLFNALVGLQEITHGKILINGLPPENSIGKISYVPQKEQVNWRFPLSVQDVVALGKLGKGSILQKLGFLNDPIIEESLRKVDMWSHRNDLVSNLSGGQRQRTFIARALTQEAEILLLDEAFSGVDFSSQEGVLDVLKDLRDEGKTILMATHDLNSLSDRFDEVICINRHICAHGNPQSVFTEEVLTELYGAHGEKFAEHQMGRHHHGN